MLKSLFLPTTGQTYALSASAMAANLAAQQKARLHAFFVRPDARAAVPFMGEGLTAEAIQALCDAAEKEAADAETTAKNYLAALREDAYLDASTYSFSVKEGAVSDYVGRQARVSDMAVCPQPHSDYSDTYEILNDILFRSGRLMLMVPEGHRTLGEHSVIAWNGSAECARAVSAALPLLKDCNKVTLLQVGDILYERPSVEDAALMLDDHNIKADVQKIASQGSTANTILDSACDLGGNFIVLGAYSQARWRELILGGVTRTLVHNSTIPLLMSH